MTIKVIIALSWAFMWALGIGEIVATYDNVNVRNYVATNGYF